ncbi:hypothetical protein Tco_0223130 [Tanacetum coccineum]
MSNNTFATQASCPGKPTKLEKKRSKHKDEPFVKDGKLSKKGRTITCQSYGNIRHNKATCKGQGRRATTGGNNAEASGSASRQAQQTELAIGQDGSGGSGVGVVIGLLAADGQGGAGVGVGSQASDNDKFPMVDEEDLMFKKISPTTEEIMVTLREGLEKNCNSPSDSHPAILITKNMSAVENIVDGLRDIVFYVVEKAMKKYPDDE